MDDWEPYVMVLADQSFSEVGLSPALLPGALRENVAFARDVTAWSRWERHLGACRERPRCRVKIPDLSSAIVKTLRIGICKDSTNEESGETGRISRPYISPWRRPGGHNH